VTDFSQLRILIDSHDLALPHGTGLRTYGLTLIEALRRLGAEPRLLVSARQSRNTLVARRWSAMCRCTR